MTDSFNWHVAREASEPIRRSKRIAEKQSPSHPEKRIRVDFRCETIKKSTHYYVDVALGQDLYVTTESHREPRIERCTTFFDYALPARDLKKLLLRRLQFFALGSIDDPNRKRRLVKEVISHAQNLISKEKECSSLSSLIVNVKKKVFYFQNHVTEEICTEGNDGGGHELKSCTVCLEDIAKGNKVWTLPCSHVFHSKCIVEWLKRGRSCPVCRFEMSKPKRRPTH